jgi:hypothetical protein
MISARGHRLKSANSAALSPSLSPSFTSARSALLQRKCACGGTPGPSGECEACRRKKLQRKSKNSGLEAQNDVGVPPIVHEVLPAAGRPLDAGTRAFFEPRFGHDFSQVPLNSPGYSSDGLDDDEGKESVDLPVSRPASPPVPTQPLPQVARTCPSGTRVDDTTDLTQAGLQAGFLSAYGIIARMRVLPDATTWDGRQLTETLAQASSTCPAGLTQPGPCSGSSTFTVGGASGHSNVNPVQPAMRNRFYDFHTSRSRTVSFLHDPTRNPTGMHSCETVCQQLYSCNGMPVGMHTITRRFSKSTFNGRNVTIINVTKQDPVSGPGDFPPRTLPRGEEYASLASEPGGPA